MRLRLTSLSWILLLGVVACKQAPTRVTEAPIPAWTRLTETAKKPLKITDESVVLDARSSFDYGLGHWSNAIHFEWTQLLQDSKKTTTLLSPQKAAAKLALLGINPKTPVIVIGYGLKGRGEEGFLAWAMTYYGVEEVQTVSMDGLDVYFTNQETPPRRNADRWDATVRDFMVIDKDNFMKAALSPRNTAGLRTFIIDVRSQKEYFNRNPGYAAPDVQSVNIEWKEFFGEDGRPKRSIKKQIMGIGAKLHDQILVVADNGIRSGAASYALVALGFDNVQHFVGGWDAILKK